MTEEELRAKEKMIRLESAELDLWAKKRALEEKDKKEWRKKKDQNIDQKLTLLTRTGCFFGGVVLVSAGVADALVNPFAFIEAPQLIAAGTGLMIVSATGKRKESND